jgi:hypothetical protein
VSCYYWGWLLRGRRLLTRSSENAVVERGVKALNNIYRMTARIPHLMKQSHLESSEGESLFLLPSHTIRKLLTPRQPGLPTGSPSSNPSPRSAPTRAARSATSPSAPCSARCCRRS